MLSPATMTSAGIILGTAAYMAPEQARGKAVDRRADIWAFGCVLYEMLTGRRTFEGEEVTDTLAGILRGDPAWDALPPSTPQSMRRLLRRCLQKDPRERLQAIGDARLEIAEALRLAARMRGSGRPPAPLVTLSAFRSLERPCVTALDRRRRHMDVEARGRRDEPRVTRSLIAVDAFDQRPPRQTRRNPGAIARPDRTAIALSPDGRTLVFRGIASNINPGGGTSRSLFVRSLDSLTARPIATTTGADSPFFSPDGAWIGYVDAGELRRVPATEDEATYTTITHAAEPHGSASPAPAGAMAT